MVMMALEGLERVLQVAETLEKSRSAELSNEEAWNEESEKSFPSASATSSVVGSIFNATLIESLEQHKNSAVAKCVARIWKQVRH